MKKILISALLAVIALTSVSCSSVSENESSESSAKNDDSSDKLQPENAAKKMAEDLTTLTNDNIFLELFGMPSEINDLLKDFQGANADTDTIYSLELKYDELANIVNADSASLNDLSAPAKAKIMENIARTFTIQMSEYETHKNIIAALSVLNYSATFSGLTDVSDQIWFMPTDKEGISICVSFIETSENVTTANASYFCYNNDYDLENSINSCIKKAGITAAVKER